MTEPTDELRKTVRRAIMEAEQANGDSYHIADAAIAAYRQHPDGAAADRAEAAMLRDPAALHINLLRGNYLTREQLLHLGGEAAQIAVAEATARAEKAAAERDQLQRSFDLSYKSDMWAIERWQAANPGNDLVFPDSTNLKIWLLERLEKAEAERDAAEREWGLCEQQKVKAYRAGWIASRDAAADEIDCGCDHRRAAVAGTKSSRYGVCQQGECLARLAADIRALTPPETAP